MTQQVTGQSLTSPDAPIVGMDIGGANLKYATLDGRAMSRSFPMWRSPNDLSATLRKDLEALCDRRDPFATIAVTMTGELADCFFDRAKGVGHIIDHVMDAAEGVGITEVQFYCVDGRFRSAREANDSPDLVAAANWHALGSYVARCYVPDGVLVDIGSTTTDLIPLAAGQVSTHALTDHQRLTEGSLVYVGGRRTPVCGLVDRLRFRGRDVPVMNECFATIDDARLLLGLVCQDDDCDTADGQPRNRRCAGNRLARMIGLDHRDLADADAIDLAIQVTTAARERIQAALNRFLPASQIVISGHADDLIELPDEIPVIRLSEKLTPQMARCAPSYAVASLLAESCGDIRDRSSTASH